MKTELLDARPETNEKSYRKSIARAAELLKAGEAVAFPTDTVYGVAAVANQPSAVARLYVAKNRPPEKSIPILVAHLRALDDIASNVNDLALQLMNQFWPGGLTLILRKSDGVLSEVSPTSTVAVRLPDLPLARQIIAAVGSPLAVTSANRSGQPSPRTALEVMAQLGGRIAAIVDGGPSPGGIPSTILDCTVTPPHLVRTGAVALDALREYVPTIALNQP